MDLSIIIPAYNAEKTIERCIDSVVRECTINNLNYEIIVVNDGSKDSTVDIVNKLKSENNNIQLITQENAGPSAARNKGLETAKGEFIALNDSDDEWIEGKLKLQLTYLQQNEKLNLVSGQRRTSIYKKEIEITFNKLAFHNYFATSSVLFRNKIGSIKFPENMKYSEDLRFFIQILEKNRCAYLPVPVTRNIFGKMDFGESGLSGNLKEMEKGELSNLKYMLKAKDISLFIFICAYIYSNLKYLRRITISRLKREKNK